MGARATTVRHGEEPTDDRELLGPRALRAWITGERDAHARVFLLESAAGAGAVAAVADAEDVLLLPEGSASVAGPARIARYAGDLAALGDELFFGERGVELQDYIAASFVQIVGPTAMRFFDASSWRAFLDDADLARRTGVFAAAMIDPRVLLADRRALASPGETAAPSALRIDGDGRVHLGLQGGVIGDVDDLPALLAQEHPRTATLGGIAAAGDLVAGLARRDWMARYLDAADLCKMLRLSNGAARIAGFGWSFLEDGLADAEPVVTDPFLLDTAEGLLLADVGTLRRQLLTPPTAAVVAAMQTSSTLDLAAARVTRACGVPDSHARRLCHDALGALGVHLGRPARAADGAAAGR
ncbi:daptide biosynthesis RiPP recognition protein [Microbacterium sp. BLY]|uniref:daptide biosynthesis RiPP recognition protein n=1 Tax=Microbacterium sp. BLY TaxID=2823280 RepID=UPI001B318DCF|nr:daptide biosynthesis RiPP recognition protein [Microbacterium sp. BLY]MBP3976142.1 hypothetical protein [Microbacterium sp. BLY]